MNMDKMYSLTTFFYSINAKSRSLKLPTMKSFGRFFLNCCQGNAAETFEIVVAFLKELCRFLSPGCVFLNTTHLSFTKCVSGV